MGTVNKPVFNNLLNKELTRVPEVPQSIYRYLCHCFDSNLSPLKLTYEVSPSLSSIETFSCPHPAGPSHLPRSGVRSHSVIPGWRGPNAQKYFSTRSKVGIRDHSQDLCLQIGKFCNVITNVSYTSSTKIGCEHSCVRFLQNSMCPVIYSCSKLCIGHNLFPNWTTYFLYPEIFWFFISNIHGHLMQLCLNKETIWKLLLFSSYNV